ncbi:unnamed protein product [Lactuca saligna]|uniref:DUF4283 domain-containing protein n=1 Tax=Lactuca saligna TaxID=75948 RepID=A0AA35V7C4_LACSI|nr:unnamed protein product [Lactuca saligna]
MVKVNVARYEKKSNKSRAQPFHNTCPPQPPDTRGWNKTMAGRSFVDSVIGRREEPAISLVILKRVFVMESDSLVMGEVKNFQHLSNLPKLLNADGKLPCQVFYAGSLRVIMKFSVHNAATVYLQNEHTGNRWFKWLKPGIVEEFPFERIAWVNFICLPIHLRFEENVNLIASKIDKVIETESSQNWHSIDLTTPHISGNRSPNIMSMSRNQSERMEREGISETWDYANHQDIEEGEIILDSKMKIKIGSGGVARVSSSPMEPEMTKIPDGQTPKLITEFNMP